MPGPSRRNPLARHLARAALAALLLAPALPALVPPASAQDAAPSIPGFSLIPDGVTVNWSTGGALPTLSSESTLLVEVLELRAGEEVPDSTDAQAIFASGSDLAMTDDLGLQATLTSGTAYFAEKDEAAGLTAAGDVTIVRARVVGPEPLVSTNEDIGVIVITIGDQGCRISSDSATRGSELLVVNESSQEGFIRLLGGAEITVAPRGHAIVTLPGDGSATKTIVCRPADPSIAISDTFLIKLETGIPLTVITNAATARGTLLLKADIATPTDSNLALVLTNLTLAPGASFPESTAAGPTGWIAIDGDITINRPNKLSATLPAGRGVVLPAGTTATVSNTSDQPIEVLVVAVVPAYVVIAAEAGLTETIDLGGCPAIATVVAGTDVALVNSTSSPIAFAIRSLDVSLRVEPGQMQIFRVPSRAGTWFAECGSARSILSLTILSSAPKKSACSFTASQFDCHSFPQWRDCHDH